MIITRSGLTIRCARCDSEVSHFAAAYDPVKAAWIGTAFCHGDSAAIAVPDAVCEATVFRPRASPTHGIRPISACAATSRQSAADQQTKTEREHAGAPA